MTEERKQALMHSGIAVHECIARLGGNERLYERVLSTYLRDTNAASLEIDSDPQDALLHAHSLKGVSASLGFTALHELTDRMCTLLRSHRADEAFTLVPDVIAEHRRICSLIEEGKDEN